MKKTDRNLLLKVLISFVLVLSFMPTQIKAAEQKVKEVIFTLPDGMGGNKKVVLDEEKPYLFDGEAMNKEELDERVYVAHFDHTYLSLYLNNYNGGNIVFEDYGEGSLITIYLQGKNKITIREATDEFGGAIGIAGSEHGTSMLFNRKGTSDTAMLEIDVESDKYVYGISTFKNRMPGPVNDYANSLFADSVNISIRVKSSNDTAVGIVTAGMMDFKNVELNINSESETNTAYGLIVGRRETSEVHFNSDTFSSVNISANSEGARGIYSSHFWLKGKFNEFIVKSNFLTIQTNQPEDIYFVYNEDEYQRLNYKEDDLFVEEFIRINQVEYNLIVENGSGSGLYEQGKKISIEANDAPFGQVFDKWLSSGVSVNDELNPHTYVIMPENSATVTATYKDLEKELLMIGGLVDKGVFTYDGAPKQPLGTVEVEGDKVPVDQLEVIYESTDGRGYSSVNPPTNAGNYLVMYKIADDNENYYGQVIYDFTIEKAIPVFEKPTNLEGIEGRKLVDVILPERFEWMDDTFTLYPVGIQIYKAVYMPEDRDNYEDVLFDVEVNVIALEAEYTIDVVFAPGGSASASVTKAKAGDIVTLVLNVDAGYEFDRWNVLAGTLNIVDNKFVMPAQDVLIQAEFYKLTTYTYDIIVGANPVWTLGDSGVRVITIDADYEDFITVEVDGKELHVLNFSVKAGSTIVTLYDDYLNTLAVGDHDVCVIFEEREVCTNLLVSAKEDSKLPEEDKKDEVVDDKKEEAKTPPTGVNTYTYTFVSMLLISILVFLKAKIRRYN